MIRKFKIDGKKVRKIDVAILVTSITLCLFGILNIYLATKGDTYSTPYLFSKKQLIWFLISLVALYLMISFDYRRILNYVPIAYGISIILLLLVWVPKIGVKVNGATGWINLGICKLQPAEIAKFTLILMLAKLIDEFDGNINNFKNFRMLLFYAALPMLLILIQKDMGMTMVCFFIVLGIIFIAGLNSRIIIGGFLTVSVSILILWNFNLILPHQKSRIMEFMSSEQDVSGNGYQLNKGVIGVGAGGLVGTKLSLDPSVSPGYTGSYVPEVLTDFIFTAVAEQWGFLGAIFVLILYGVLIVKILSLSRKARDIFGSLICVGMASYILFAVIQNIGMTIGLLPITGITLPLLSYGGSSLLTTVMAIGLVLNIGINREKITFYFN